MPSATSRRGSIPFISNRIQIDGPSQDMGFQCFLHFPNTLCLDHVCDCHLHHLLDRQEKHLQALQNADLSVNRA